MLAVIGSRWPGRWSAHAEPKEGAMAVMRSAAARRQASAQASSAICVCRSAVADPQRRVGSSGVQARERTTAPAGDLGTV